MSSASIKTKQKKKVFVGLSGGVDSSTAAALLKKEGYDVTGVFIKTWHPDFLPCTWKEERLDAMRVAARLDIPFLTFDFEKEYKQKVADYFISEYKLGRTPNPDVMCNKEIKFGAFLKRAREMGADFIATGHYARKAISDERLAISRNDKHLNAKRYTLNAGLDKNKDQTYFLWTLSQKQLKHIIFPIGEYKKDEVRRIAKKFGLQTAQKKDSQGICFLGKTDMMEFLSHYIKPKKGDLLNEFGKKIGTHNGVMFYTIGQRHGFYMNARCKNTLPYYVVSKNIRKNTIVVSNKNISLIHSLSTHKGTSFGNRKIYLENVNWILGELPNLDRKYRAQIRYRGKFLPCRLVLPKTKQGGTARLVFDEPQASALGQSAVIYDKDICLGGGIVK